MLSLRTPCPIIGIKHTSRIRMGAAKPECKQQMWPYNVASSPRRLTVRIDQEGHNCKASGVRLRLLFCKSIINVVSKISSGSRVRDHQVTTDVHLAWHWCHAPLGSQVNRYRISSALARNIFSSDGPTDRWPGSHDVAPGDHWWYPNYLKEMIVEMRRVLLWEIILDP